MSLELIVKLALTLAVLVVFIPATVRNCRHLDRFDRDGVPSLLAPCETTARPFDATVS